MGFKEDWDEFKETFGGMVKLIFVSIPALLVPIANALSVAFGGDEFLPLGEHAAFAGSMAPIVSGFIIMALFSTRRRLAMLILHEKRASNRATLIKGGTLLFLSLPVTLFFWGFSGWVLVYTEYLSPSFLHAIVYILSFSLVTLSIGLISMKEYLLGKDSGDNPRVAAD